MIKYILIFLFAILIGYIWVAFFKKIKLLDKPGPDIIPTRKPVPHIQWVVMIIWFLLSIAIFFPQYFLDKNINSLFIWSIILGVVTTIDAFKKTSIKFRLLIQIIVICMAFFLSWVGLNEFVMPWFGEIKFPMIIWLILTIVWFAWFMNAINWFDWINWLASGVSSIWFLTIFLLIHFVVYKSNPDITPEKYQILQLVSNVSFILFAFSTVYSFIEFKPWWVLRDVGVMFLWFSLAYLSLLWWAKIWTILVALSLVIFDSIWVFINRIWIMKKSPMKWDFTHLHYRLLALKWNRTEVRFFIWIWSLFFMIVMILQWDNRFNKIIIFILMLLLFFGLNVYLFWIKKLPFEYQILKWWKKVEKTDNIWRWT